MFYNVVDQEDEIQREIESLSPMFSPVLPLSTLESEYQNNFNFLRKIPKLSQSFPSFRRTRGDGNCFYRSVMFCILEQFIKNKDQVLAAGAIGLSYQNIIEKVKSSAHILSAAGFEAICYEDFIDLILEKLEGVKSSSVEVLSQEFEDKMLADSIVMYSRFLISAYLRLNSDRFEGFTEGYATVLDYCKSEVEPMDRESEQLQVMAMSEAFNIKIQIEYMDRSDSDNCTQLIFPESYSGPDFTVHLLYRPGHYDLLYAPENY